MQTGFQVFNEGSGREQAVRCRWLGAEVSAADAAEERWPARQVGEILGGGRAFRGESNPHG